MKNCAETTAHWVRFIAARPEFIAGEALLAQFSAGKITRLCDCGCNSFNVELENGKQAAPTPIAAPSKKSQVVFLAEFQTEQPPSASLEFIMYADTNGNFGGLDVQLNGNTEAMPDKLVIAETPYHVYGTLARSD